MVRVEPAGVTFDLLEGESLLAAAARAGYRWPTVCGGLAECGVCVVEVLEAEPDEREPANPAEEHRLASVPERRLRPGAVLRLACQFRPGSGDAVVAKRGVRRRDPAPPPPSGSRPS